MGEGPVSPAPERRHNPQDDPDDADLDAAQQADAAPDDDRESIGPVLCPNCMSPNDESAHLCRVCMTPLSSHATIDPIFSISARGDTFSKATRARSPIIFIGIWLLFAPISFFLLLAAGAAWSNGSTSYVLILPMAAITIAILVKTTKNYIQGPPDDREGFPLSDYKADPRSENPERNDEQNSPPAE